MCEGSYRRALDRIESKLSNAPRMNSISDSLVNIFSNEVETFSKNINQAFSKEEEEGFEEDE